jgi:crossover junction endodeoxyribonuclease RuvC
MEECFVGRYARAALVLGHARGALMVAVLSERLPLFEYAPREIKMAVTGSGGAHKKQIQAMVPRLVAGLPRRVSADEADALAVAVCHAHRNHAAFRVAEAGEVRR